ncbi:serine hydrolase domain-containing protein [Actinoplanes sp. NPDC051494]|uniref:serine hydrolase domain-containing protein n=1 Tax=Actinoplanes sp. NPDC051494 TaxID=3363907 RepID=UPI0037B69AE4
MIARAVGGPAVHGWAADGFEAVAEALAGTTAEMGGAAVAAYHRGRLVVDAYAGDWQPDTLPMLFSGTKGFTAACVLLLVERGQVELAAPLARYWPAFAARGKSAVTVAEVMSHQCRLPGVPGGVTVADLRDHDTMAGLLADSALDEDPRAGFVYHALTTGWLIAELVRRVDGRPLGRFFAEEFAGPLGLDAWIGLPETEHHRAATMIAGPGVLTDPAPVSRDPLRRRVHNPITVTGSDTVWNSAAFRSAGLPSVGGFATARAVARFYSCLVTGESGLAPATVALGRTALRRGVEPLWGIPVAYGVGFEVGVPHLGPVPDAFGHSGFGGSRHGAWPGRQVGFSYVMGEVRNQPDNRAATVLAALNTAVTDR